jgi:outer membrane lipoprotein-sorting protein
MTNNEKQFEQIVAGLNIDDRPNAEHKQALRKQMLDACKDTSDTAALRIQPVWSRIMKSNITKSAAAAIIVIGAFIFLTQTNGTGVAFANAMEHFVSAQTARFDLTIEYGRQEPQTSSFLYDAKGYIRQNMANGTVNFVDYKRNKVLSLLPDSNAVVIRDVKNTDFHSALYDIFTILQNLIQQAIDLGYGSVESLGTKNIDGRTAYGYYVETTGQSPGLFWQGKGTLTVWADAETNFPLTLQWHNSMTNIIVTVSNIELDVVFSPDEISITIPEGYTITDESLRPAETKRQPEDSQTMQQDTVTDLIEGLDKNDQTLIKFFHSWTVLSNGKFPSSLTTDAIKDIDPDATFSVGQKQWNFEFSAELDLSGTLGDDWKSGIDPNDYTAEEIEQLKHKRGRYYEDLQSALNEKLETIQPCLKDIFKGFEMVNDLPAKSDWHYSGADVNLGDANTVIFRYRPEDSVNFRVIFGDLTVEDVAPEDLHLLENPSGDEAEEVAQHLLETAIQLGADIPKDKRATVLRMLSLKEDDLIKGLATYLEFSGGTYPPTLNFDKTFVKHLDGFLYEAYKQEKIDKKEGEAKTLDIGFAAFFYDKLTREKKDPAYYGDKITVQDNNQILVRWKTSKGRYRVVFGNLTRKTVSKEELSELEKLQNK